GVFRVHVERPERVARAPPPSPGPVGVGPPPGPAIGTIGVLAVEVGLFGGKGGAVADTEGIGIRTPSATGILPLRLGRQTVPNFRSGIFLAQVPGKSVGLLPGDILDRQ